MREIKSVSISERIDLFKKDLQRVSSGDRYASLFVEVAVRAVIDHHSKTADAHDKATAARFINAKSYPQLEACGINSDYVKARLKKLNLI